MKHKGHNLCTVILNISLFLMTSCTSTEPNPEGSSQLFTGTIIGEKCTVYAIQLDQKGALGAQTWQKKVWNALTNETDRTDFDNVVGLIGLPQEYAKEGTRIKVEIRKASQQEASVNCYLDLPNPPEPRYIVLNASSF